MLGLYVGQTKSKLTYLHGLNFFTSLYTYKPLFYFLFRDWLKYSKKTMPNVENKFYVKHMVENFNPFFKYIIRNYYRMPLVRQPSKHLKIICRKSRRQTRKHMDGKWVEIQSLGLGAISHQTPNVMRSKKYLWVIQLLY